MKILVGVSHPKHVYMFKNFIFGMIEKGHEIKIVAVEKEITRYLLKRFNMPYTLIGKNQPNLYRKILFLLKWEYLTLKIAKEFKPDIFIGQAFPHLAHVSALLGKPFVVFEDTEVARQLHKFVLPFADAIVTPSCYKDDLGKKQVRFDGFFELAYLHPNYFKPKPTVLDELGLNKDDKFIVLRFVSWEAYHDFRQRGFDLETKQKLIEELEKYGQVFITSEARLEKKFEKYRINVQPEKIHDLLYYATMYIGEGATMATEAGILGTPSIYISSLVDTLGNFDDLEKNYGLVYTFQDSTLALEKTLQFLEKENLRASWQKKRERLLNEKIDVTKFMTEFIEKYSKI